MHVVIPIERALTRPWNDTGQWAAALGRGLVRARLRVTVLADTVLDTRPFEDAGLTLDLRRPDASMNARRPLAFRRWARRRAEEVGADVVLSLSRTMPGDVWMPLGLSAAEEAAFLFTGRNLVAKAFHAVGRTWLPQLSLAERYAAREGRRRASPVLRLSGPGGGPTELMTASLLDHPTDEELRSLRERTRGVLDLAEDEVVALASAPHLGDAGWAEMLGGLARAPGGVRLLVCGGSPHAVMSRARAAGSADRVTAISGVADPSAVMAASDVAVNAAFHPRRFGSGRFVADAIRIGRPALCARRAPGSGLIEPPGFGSPPVGLVVEENAPEAWARAFETACDRAWRERATKAARHIGAALGMDALIERLVVLLDRVASDRVSSR